MFCFVVAKIAFYVFSKFFKCELRNWQFVGEKTQLVVIKTLFDFFFEFNQGIVFFFAKKAQQILF